jgi:hypothetical protein
MYSKILRKPFTIVKGKSDPIHEYSSFCHHINNVSNSMSLERGSPSPVNGVRQFLLMHEAQRLLIDWDTSSLRGSWVRIPPPATSCY